MNHGKRHPLLADHVAIKRKLVPPFVGAAGNKLFQYSWTRQLVPEAIWIALIIDHCGYEAAVKVCRDLVITARHVVERLDAPMFVRFSAFSTLKPEEKTALATSLDASVRAEINAALRPLCSIASSHPLAFLDVDSKPEDLVANNFAVVLRECYDRNGRLSVLSMALAYRLGIDQGKVHVADHLVDDLIHRFKAIGNYPDTEAAQQAAGAFRAAAPNLFMMHQDEGRAFQNDEAWGNDFWDGVAGFGPCLLPDTIQDEDPESDDPAEAFIIAYRNSVRNDLRERLKQWPLNLKAIETYEVVSALICRQATLAIDLASAPAIWNPHTAPIILRAMADVFISMAWILKDPGPRSKQFVEDGLGAMKLQVAHQERALEQTTDPDERERLSLMIEVGREWLASQRMHQFVEVNLGSWSGLNTRKMADEAGFIDFYNHVYQPFSGVAHSNWTHVSIFNTVHCQNPAHRGHRAPAIVPTDPDPHWLLLATKYLSKALGHFDEVHGLTNLPHGAFDFIETQIVASGSEIE
ncbi:DUF5677 domain-containing protein [Microvirga sp. P5_D2]